MCAEKGHLMSSGSTTVNNSVEIKSWYLPGLVGYTGESEVIVAVRIRSEDRVVGKGGEIDGSTLTR
jgi:hypothetical protein